LPVAYNDNDFYEVVRSVAGDLVEEVKIQDTFRHPKTGRESKCYRILYRHMDRNLKNDEVDELQFKIRDDVVRLLNVELR